MALSFNCWRKGNGTQFHVLVFVFGESSGIVSVEHNLLRTFKVGVFQRTVKSGHCVTLALNLTQLRQSYAASLGVLLNQGILICLVSCYVAVFNLWHC